MSAAVNLSYSDGVAEQLEEAEVVSGGEQGSVSGERRGVDVGDVAVRRPDSLTARTQNTRPAGPVHPLQLHNEQSKTHNNMRRRVIIHSLIVGFEACVFHFCVFRSDWVMTSAGCMLQTRYTRAHTHTHTPWPHRSWSFVFFLLGLRRKAAL